MINRTLFDHYRRLRRPYFPRSYPGKAYVTPAHSALVQARYAVEADKTRALWDSLNGYVCDEYDAPTNPANSNETGRIRLRIVADNWLSFDDLAGDTFNPRVNSDINPNILAREEKEFRERVDRNGVCGIIGEYWNGKDWEHADSCFGFVGDDWRDSGYDVDIMSSTINAYRDHLQQATREYEATRPDMYRTAEAS